MNELLSADELSELLEAVNEGQAPAAVEGEGERSRTVQAFDFRQPARLSPQQSRTLQQRHDVAASALATVLTDAVGAPVEVSLVAVEAVTFGAFNGALSAPACIQTFRADPGGHRGLLCLDAPLAFAVIERLLGGKGQALEQPRPLTAIEQAVVAGPLDRLLGRLAEVWRGVAPVALTPEALALSPKAAHILDGRDIVLQVLFAVGGDVCVGDMSLCVPLPFVHQMLPQDEPGLPEGERAARCEAVEALRRALAAAPVRVGVELGRTAITVLELLRLRPGHVVTLDRQVGDPLDVTVERAPYLAGRPGLVGHKLGVQIAPRPTQARKGEAQP
ncbi:MAG: flagellar motor switch protein FliM [Planctomycetota bacterium]